MTIIVTVQIDLAKCTPSLIEEFELDKMSEAELLEWVADYFGDCPDSLLTERFAGCLTWVKDVKRVK